MKINAFSVLLSVLSLPVFTVKPVEKPTPVSAYDQESFRKSFFDASRVYGRAGCGDIYLAELTARSAQKTGLPANVIAALISVESTCNPLAVSKDGDVGLTQVQVKVWAGKYNNFRDKNLLRQEDSIDVGMEILAENVKIWGLRQGIRHYNGAGENAELYAAKVMQLAEAK
jgi:soluble lytic murein transglycosylase-like protein